MISNLIEVYDIIYFDLYIYSSVFRMNGRSGHLIEQIGWSSSAGDFTFVRTKVIGEMGFSTSTYDRSTSWAIAFLFPRMMATFERRS